MAEVKASRGFDLMEAHLRRRKEKKVHQMVGGRTRLKYSQACDLFFLLPVYAQFLPMYPFFLLKSDFSHLLEAARHGSRMTFHPIH